MSWKGVKCVGCDKDIGCPNCGQILPDLKMVKEEGVGYFCSSECRDEWHACMHLIEEEVKNIAPSS